MTGPILLIDGTGLLVRCNRAGRSRGMHAGGARTGPLLLFINSVARLIRAHQPSYVLVALDGPHARDWRRSLVPSYKANRPAPPDRESAEYELAVRFLSAAGIGSLLCDGYEADDVIGYAWRRWLAAHADFPVVIASDDADLHQLAGGVVTQVPLSNGARPVVTGDWVRDHYGCEPSQLPLLKAVMGDKSDNVRGIPGVGPARALDLLSQAKWVLLNIEHKALAESATLERELCLNEDIFNLRGPIHAIWMEPGMDVYPLWRVMAWKDEFPSPMADYRDPDALRVFLDRYDLASVSRRLEAGRLW